MFDHEKLRVYQTQLKFVGWVTDLLSDVKKQDSVGTTEIRRQLDRAALSVLLNIAEGNGRRIGQSRAKFFDDSRGSVTECAACLDALVAKNACSESQISEGKQLLEQVYAMLTKLVARFDQSSNIVAEETCVGF